MQTYIHGDRGEPRGSSPPTPPGIRVRTTAVRSPLRWEDRAVPGSLHPSRVAASSPALGFQEDENRRCLLSARPWDVAQLLRLRTRKTHPHWQPCPCEVSDSARGPMKPIRAASLSRACERLGGERHVEQEVPKVGSVAQGVEVVVCLEVREVSETVGPGPAQLIHRAACQ